MIMAQNELKEKYLQVYNEIHRVKGFYDIIMAVLRDNECVDRNTDIFPVANIIDEKLSKLSDNADYFLWELHDKNLI